jgi:hypothetical protein
VAAVPSPGRTRWSSEAVTFDAPHHHHEFQFELGFFFSSCALQAEVVILSISSSPSIARADSQITASEGTDASNSLACLSTLLSKRITIFFVHALIHSWFRIEKKTCFKQGHILISHEMTRVTQTIKSFLHNGRISGFIPEVRNQTKIITGCKCLKRNNLVNLVCKPKDIRPLPHTPMCDK